MAVDGGNAWIYRTKRVEARCLLVMSGKGNEGRTAVANRLREITWNLDTFEEGYRTKVLRILGFA